MKFVTIIGARPQFVKAGPVSRVLRAAHTEVMIHTGQHYDQNMSDVFFSELGIPAPDYNLAVGSVSHGAQTGRMLEKIEEVIKAESPDWVLVYGDTNSTLAGALAAAKLDVRVAHVEAGLRSFVRSMPEEINRVLTDHVSSLLLVPSESAVRNLAAEGISRGVRLVGDVMSDALFAADERARATSKILDSLGLKAKTFALATCHRADSTDHPDKLAQILSALGSVGMPVILPLHPRTKSAIAQHGLTAPPTLRIIEPVGYLDMVRLEGAAALILTDSGGVQKEAYWLSVPCVTMRAETEWTETVDAGWNRLGGTTRDGIVSAAVGFVPPTAHPPLYGAGQAATAVVAAINAYAE